MSKSGPLWRKATVAEYTGMSIPELDRRRKDGRFPEPVKLGPRSIAWVAADVEAWVSNLIEQQGAK